MKTSKLTIKRSGFTLTELLVAVAVSAILAGLTGASYISIQRLVGRSENDLLLAQNARVVIDRISRDLRQAVSVVSTVPDSKVDAITSLEFEDGHEVNPAGPTYIIYQLEGDQVWRRRQYYYNVDNPDIRLPFNPVLYQQGEYEVMELSAESYVIADHVTALEFYGSEDLVQIDVGLQMSANAPEQDFHSAVAKRN